jgi:hypothetical protein
MVSLFHIQKVLGTPAKPPAFHPAQRQNMPWHREMLTLSPYLQRHKVKIGSE